VFLDRFSYYEFYLRRHIRRQTSYTSPARAQVTSLGSVRLLTRGVPRVKDPFQTEALSVDEELKGGGAGGTGICQAIGEVSRTVPQPGTLAEIRRQVKS
jgi:hypothetical protein